MCIRARLQEIGFRTVINGIVIEMEHSETGVRLRASGYDGRRLIIEGYVVKSGATTAVVDGTIFEIQKIFWEECILQPPSSPFDDKAPLSGEVTLGDRERVFLGYCTVDEFRGRRVEAVAV